MQNKRPQKNKPIGPKFIKVWNPDTWTWEKMRIESKNLKMQNARR